MSICKKNILLFILFILLTGFGSVFNADDRPYIEKWVIIPGGSLSVDGSTNVNKFNCEITSYSRPDTLILRDATSGPNLAVSGNIRLDVQGFDCHNAVMTSDLRKTLKAKEYPSLHIRFLTLNKLPSNSQESIKGLVDIQLAGVTKRFDVHYKFMKDGRDMMHLVGSRNVNFSDFNLTPPRKLGGMIQTNDELKVEFRLKMKVIKEIRD